MIRKAKGVIGATAALLCFAAGTPAEAKIVCSKGLQKVQGSWLVTPYCQDEFVAAVAREYGFKASADAIRYNPNFKRQICRFVGQDIRIKESCGEVNSRGRGRL